MLNKFNLYLYLNETGRQLYADPFIFITSTNISLVLFPDCV